VVRLLLVPRQNVWPWSVEFVVQPMEWGLHQRQRLIYVTPDMRHLLKEVVLGHGLVREARAEAARVVLLLSHTKQLLLWRQFLLSKPLLKLLRLFLRHRLQLLLLQWLRVPLQQSAKKANCVVLLQKLWLTKRLTKICVA
jgi:hypothetical protein